MRGLYLHIPFCEAKCHYCNFVITVQKSPLVRNRFFAVLEKEIEEAAARYGRLEFDTIYFGGGTPSLLSAEELKNIFHLLNRKFQFKDKAEFTCEINPGDGDLNKFKAMRALGINRVSLGIQAFQDRLLKSLGRKHNTAQIESSLRDLKSAGFHNISVDLINRLPAQSLNDFKESLTRTAESDIQQVSLYDLEVHAETVFGQKQKKGLLTLPDEELHEAMFQTANEILGKAGLIPYEISTFAKPGFESRHNLIYWHNEEYLGLGPGAYSYLEGKRYQFAGTVTRYLNKIETGIWEPDVCDALSDEKKELETLLTGIRLKEGVPKKIFPILAQRLTPVMDHLRSSGAVTETKTHFYLTDKGRFLAEAVLAELTAC